MNLEWYSKFNCPDEGNDPEVEAVWAAEIERRIAEVENGAETIIWEEARAQIRADLAESSR
jgi:hypothetical protein